MISSNPRAIHGDDRIIYVQMPMCTTSPFTSHPQGVLQVTMFRAGINVQRNLTLISQTL